MSEVTETQRRFMAALSKKLLPKLQNGGSYSWPEFERRIRIKDYLFERKFKRGGNNV